MFWPLSDKEVACWEWRLGDIHIVKIGRRPRIPLCKGGVIDFLKFGNKGGDEIFFLEREGLD